MNPQKENVNSPLHVFMDEFLNARNATEIDVVGDNARISADPFSAIIMARHHNDSLSTVASKVIATNRAKRKQPKSPPGNSGKDRTVSRWESQDMDTDSPVPYSRKRPSQEREQIEVVQKPSVVENDVIPMIPIRWK